jgi:1-acyl-sn-glycerol-3-phosphate acyltransferase
MIKADHKYWARALFNSYIKRLLKKHFNSFLLTNNLPDINNHKLIITPNHFSWWDGFFIDFVNEKLIKRKLHILMLEDQLKRYWFFRKLGAYGFNPSNPKSIIEAVNYTKDVLNDKNISL